MSLKETQGNVNYFVFEHNHQYQQVQFKFYDAVESLNPQNIMVNYDKLYGDLWYMYFVKTLSVVFTSTAKISTVLNLNYCILLKYIYYTFEYI